MKFTTNPNLKLTDLFSFSLNEDFKDLNLLPQDYETTFTKMEKKQNEKNNEIFIKNPV